VVAYVDTSALLKRYVLEADSALAERLLGDDPVLVSSWVTAVEVRRNLARLLGEGTLATVRRRAERDLDRIALVTCDGSVATLACEIAEQFGVRSLDAVHMASAKRLMIDDLSFITFDLRQAETARRLGMRVLGC
jgi:predicted nucleic acid-binding protein